jgi:hypothetical protein
MEIPEKWWRQDMARQQRELDELDEEIVSGEINRKEGDRRYVPESGIRLNRT